MQGVAPGGGSVSVAPPSSAASSSSSTSRVFDQFDATIDLYGGAARDGAAGGDGGFSGRSGFLCLKVTLMACNLIFLIFSIVLMALGSYALSSQVNQLTGVTLPAGLICLGVFVFVLSGCGALSVWKESRVGLALYILALAAIVVALFVVGVVVVVKKGQAAAYIQQGWWLAPPDLRQTLEIDFSCCGLTALPNATSSPGNSSAAAALCPQPPLVAAVATQPCLPLLVSAFQSNYQRAGGCGVAFAVLMGAVIVLAVLLMKGIAKRRVEAETRDGIRREGGGAAAGDAQAAISRLRAGDDGSYDNDDGDDDEAEDDDDDGEDDGQDDSLDEGLETGTESRETAARQARR